MKLIEIVKKKRNSKRLKKVNLNDKDKESVNSEKHRKRKTIVDYVNEQKKLKMEIKIIIMISKYLKEVLYLIKLQNSEKNLLIMTKQ